MNLQKLQNIPLVMDDYIAQKRVAGCNVLICKDGNEIFYADGGLADIEKHVAFKRNTICRLYSMSKPVTAVAAMILLEQGKLDLAEEVGRYIPEFWNLTVCDEPGRNGKPRKSSRPLLVQDLLNMTSGYTYGAWSPESPLGEHLTSDLLAELNKDVMGANKITTMDVAKRLAAIPVDFEPGTDYQYGLSADILGVVIEAASGMKFSDFLKKYIFNPLGMKDTDFWVPENKQERLAKSYEEIGDKDMKKLDYAHLGVQPWMDHSPAFESGGAGLNSTADDYMKFCNMLANKGELNGIRILEPRTVEYMAQARLRPNLQKCFDQKMEHLCGYTYCNLNRIAINPGQCKALTEEGEFGWDGWLGPYMSVDLKNNLTIVMMMQKVNSGTWDMTRKIKNIIYSSL